MFFHFHASESIKKHDDLRAASGEGPRMEPRVPTQGEVPFLGAASDYSQAYPLISHHGRARPDLLHPAQHILGGERPLPPTKSLPPALHEILLQQDEHRHEHLLRSIQLLHDPAGQIGGLLPQQPREGGPGGPSAGVRHLPADLAVTFGQLPFHSGIEIQQNTYRILLKMFRSKRAIAKERESVEIQSAEEEVKGTRTRTIQSVARRNGKHQTAFFNRIADLGQERARLQEIKFLLKSNLYVKPAVQRPQQKYSIQQIKQRQQPHRQQYSLLHIRRSRQSPQKFTIQTNQLSHAFSSNSSLKLTDIKNHSIHCSHTRKISRPNLPKENRKLEIRREEARNEDRKGSKQVKNWTKIVTEMKEELYHHDKDLRLSEQMTFGHFEKRINFEPKRNEAKKIIIEPRPQSKEETIKFSKIDLCNSPNIIIYEGGASQPSEEQPSEQPQEAYQTKVNYVRPKSRKRQNAVPPILSEAHKI